MNSYGVHFKLNFILAESQGTVKTIKQNKRNSCIKIYEKVFYFWIEKL